MAIKIVRLKVEPEMMEIFMNCFTVNSLIGLQTEQNNGFQFVSPRDGFVDVVLIKHDRVSADIDEELIPVVRTPADLVAVAREIWRTTP